MPSTILMLSDELSNKISTIANVMSIKSKNEMITKLLTEVMDRIDIDEITKMIDIKAKESLEKQKEVIEFHFNEAMTAEKISPATLDYLADVYKKLLILRPKEMEEMESKFRLQQLQKS